MPKLNAREQLALWRGVYPAPCQAACPVHTDARSYVTLIAEGRFPEAYLAAREPNPLAAICGRACSAPCEDVCTRAEFDRPLRIRELKRFLTDSYTAAPAGEGDPPKTARQIAVVGAGPAGLAAAHELARIGHTVTVYEAEHEPGGMATLGVPRFRLAIDAIRRDVNGIEKMGVKIERGVVVGRDIALDNLRAENSAVFIAAGAARLNELTAAGTHLPGVVQALPYLREANLGGRPPTGRVVAVIGGGYTAMDAARTALRLGAERVTVLYRRTQHETEVHEEELRATLDEGVAIQYLVSPVEFLSDESGNIRAVLCVRNQLGEPDASGRPRPVALPGTEFEFAADMVILALGQSPDPSGLAPDGQGTLWPVDPETLMTPLEGVFAGGDFVSGPATIIEAVRDGQAAARAIDAYLSPTAPPESSRHLNGLRPLEVLPLARTNGAHGGHASGLALDREVESTMTADQAMSEGLRCLYCGLLPSIVFDDCTLCHACAQVCPVDCLWIAAVDDTGAVRPATSFREAVSYEIDSDLCIRCGRCFGACPVGAIVVET